MVNVLRLNLPTHLDNMIDTTTGVIHLTDENFDATIQGPNIVLVDFWAPWCAPCRALSPILDELAKQYQSQEVGICKMNIDEHMHASRRFGIRTIPTILLFKAGKLMDQLTAPMSQQHIEQKINTLLTV